MPLTTVVQHHHSGPLLDRASGDVAALASGQMGAKGAASAVVSTTEPGLVSTSRRPARPTAASASARDVEFEQMRERYDEE